MRKRNKEEVIELKSFSNDILEESTVLFSNSKERITEKLIMDKVASLKKYSEQLSYENNFANVYSYAFFHNADFENALNDIKMGLEISKKDVQEVNQLYNAIYEKGLNPFSEEASKLNDHLTLALALQRNVLTGFKELRDLYLNKINMTAMAIGLRKTNKELEVLSQRLNKIISENDGSLRKANEYIFYHSGEKIVNLVKKMVEGTKQLQDHTQLDIHHVGYYINSDCIITLEIKEWTDLYNKLKFVFKMLNGIDATLYQEIKEKLEDFEANYMIIILNEEMERLRK